MFTARAGTLPSGRLMAVPGTARDLWMVGGVGVITGDPETAARVDVGTNGRGLQYGDPS
ncbi:hypothetical protein ABZ567_23320 [Streptomyces sp. NPDC016459]|uniref:hypothetical protein n=1 Tax=Streptomyces sp. NPDC016459 TaxID=3157190 RepID=UPI0033D8AAFF